MPKAQCVAWWDIKDRGNAEKMQWCALDGKADPAAIQDYTLCGQWVTLRVGCEYRTPTCPECRSILQSRRRDERKGRDSDQG